MGLIYRRPKFEPQPKADTPVGVPTAASSPMPPYIGPGPAAGPRGPAGPSTAQDVPTDGNSYLRSDAGWVSGGKVANELTVAQDPTKPLGVATKQYVDMSGAVPPFLTTKAYAVGDLALYNSVIYCCDTATGPGAFRNPDWRAQTRRNFLVDNTLYADATTGDDVYGDGSIGKPFKTLAQICAYACNEFDRVGYELDIIMGAGSYGSGSIVGSRNAINITGAGIDLTFITGLYIGDNNGNEVSTYLAPGGFTIVPPAYYPAVSVHDGGSLYLDSYGFAINVDNTNVPHYGIIGVSNGGMIYKAAAIQIRQNGIVDSSTAVINVSGAGSYFYDVYDSWVLSGSPNTYNAFLSVSNRGTYINSNGAPFTGTGIIGKQYNIVDNALATVDPTSLAALLRDHPLKGPVPENIPVGPELLVVPGTTPGTVDGTSTFNGVFGSLKVKGTSVLGPNLMVMDFGGPAIFGGGSGTAFFLNKDSGSSNLIVSTSNQLRQDLWWMHLGNDAAETGANSGSDFDLAPFNDAGVRQPSALHIERATGNVTLSGNLTAPNIRKVLAADLSLYVSTTGSDAANGSQATPWATIQKAVDYCGKLDFNGHTVIISVSAGSFIGPNIRALVGGGILQIYGAGSTLTIITNNSNTQACFFFNDQTATKIGVNGVALNVNSVGVYLVNRAQFGFGDLIQFDALTDIVVNTLSGMFTFLYLANESQYTEWGYRGSVTIAQNGIGAYYCIAADAGCLVNQSVKWILTGTPNNYGYGFIALADMSYYVNGSSGITGTTVGLKFNLTQGSSVNSGGVSNLFPGSIPGIMDASSSYDGVTGASTRNLLTADVSYSIATTGNDATGDGSTGAPWATIQHAVDFCRTKLDLGGHVVTLNIGAGTFSNGVVVQNMVGGGAIQINGAGSASTTLAAPQYSAVIAVKYTLTAVAVNGVTIKTAVYNATIYATGNGARVGCGVYTNGAATIDVVFDTIADYSMGLVQASLGGTYYEWSYGGAVTVKQNGKTNHYYAMDAYLGGTIIQQATWNLIGAADTWQNGFANLDTDSLYYNAVYPPAFTGTALGPKFMSMQGSQIITYGIGVGLFPGSQAGTWDASSGYDGVPGAGVRTQLKAAQTLYVATTGNDTTGDGTSAKPWATLDKVWAWLATVDTNGFKHTLNLGAGAFPGGDFPKVVVGGGSLKIVGAGSAQTSITPGPNGACVFIESSGFAVAFDKLTIDTTTGFYGVYSLGSVSFGRYSTGDIVFKTGPNGTGLVIAVGYVSYDGGNIEVKQCGDTSGYANPFYYSSCQVSDSATWTWTGPSDTVAPCAILADGSIYNAYGAMTGTVHGQKFALIHGSQMFSGGKGHAYFPGDIAGTVDASSWFDNVSGAPPPTPFMEPLIVTATNVIPPLAHAPINGLMQLIVNGRVFTSVGGVKSRFNPSDKSNVTLSNSDRSVAQVGSAIGNVRSVVSHSTGKWHVEFNNVHSITNTWAALFGLANANYPLNTFLGSDAGGNSLSWSYWVGSEVIYFIAGGIIPGNTYWAAADGDSFAMEVDFDAHLIWIKNITQNSTWNPWIGGAGSPMTGLAPGEYFVTAAFGSNVTNGSMTVNFGATPFAATPQAGFLPWSADVLPAFSVSGTTVVWNSTTWAINPSDEVIASYSYLPPLDATTTMAARDRLGEITRFREITEAREALTAEPVAVERLPDPRERLKLLRHEEPPPIVAAPTERRLTPLDRFKLLRHEETLH